MMRRRSQVQSQVFIYIMILIVVGATILFGYDSIQKLSKQGKETQIQQFKTQLKNDIEQITPNYESVRIKSYSIPGFSSICFGVKSAASDCDTPASHSALVQNAIASESANAFLVGNSLDSFYIGNINLGSCRVKCFNVNQGYVRIKITGKGSETLIESP